MTDIHFASVEMNGCDQPVFIAADIEDDPMVKLVGRRKDLSQFGKAMEFGFLHNLEPSY
jgi:hypothetical protein